MSRETTAGGLMQASEAAGGRRIFGLRFLRAQKMALTTIASLAVGFLLWEAIARFVVHDKLFLVAPSAVLVRFGQLWETGDLQRNIIASGEEFVLGMLAASVVGIIVGLILATNRPVR